MKQLVIDIRGPANSGKTTFAEEVYRALKDQGFDVEFTGERPRGDVPHYERMKGLKGKVAITVTQTQTNLEPKREPCRGCRVPFGDQHKPGCDYDLAT